MDARTKTIMQKRGEDICFKVTLLSKVGLPAGCICTENQYADNQSSYREFEATFLSQKDAFNCVAIFFCCHIMQIYF